jgi:POT family proton-dependent oligopeptide transporter
MRLFASIKTSLKGFPPGFYVLFFTEMWELFGRFGIIALLALYITVTLHLPDKLAFSVYSAFLAMMFVTPLLGGILSDRFLGFRRSIILGASIMMVGNCLLIIPNLQMIYLGLAVVAVGSGLFTPTLTALLGRLYDHHPHNRDAGFTFYYIAKNLGALLAPFFCGFIGQHFGYNYAFILIALGMLTGIIVFTTGVRRLTYLEEALQKEEAKTSRALSLTSPIVSYALLFSLIPIVYAVIAWHYIGVLLLLALLWVIAIFYHLFKKSEPSERRNLIGIIFMMALTVVFFAFLGQGGTTLNLFIERIVDRVVLGILVPAPVFFTLDPLFMLIMGPLIAWLWVALAKKNKAPVVSTKFIFALLFLSLGFFIFVGAAMVARSSGSASPWFVVGAYFLFPIAELCIMPIGWSLVTRLAPKGSQAMMVGIYTLGLALASYLTGIISKTGKVLFPIHNQLSKMQAAGIYQFNFLFSAFALLLLGVVCIFLNRYVKRLF